MEINLLIFFCVRTLRDYSNFAAFNTLVREIYYFLTLENIFNASEHSETF